MDYMFDRYFEINKEMPYCDGSNRYICKFEIIK